MDNVQLKSECLARDLLFSKISILALESTKHPT